MFLVFLGGGSRPIIRWQPLVRPPYSYLKQIRTSRVVMVISTNGVGILAASVNLALRSLCLGAALMLIMFCLLGVWG